MCRFLAVLAVFVVSRPLHAQRVEDARLGIGRDEAVATGGAAALPVDRTCKAHRTKTTFIGAVIAGGIGYLLADYAYGLDETPRRAGNPGRVVRFALGSAAVGGVIGFIAGSTSPLCD